MSPFKLEKRNNFSGDIPKPEAEDTLNARIQLSNEIITSVTQVVFAGFSGSTRTTRKPGPSTTF